MTRVPENVHASRDIYAFNFASSEGEIFRKFVREEGPFTHCVGSFDWDAH